MPNSLTCSRTRRTRTGGVGSGRPIFCPRDPIGPGAEKKTYTSERDIHSSPVGSTRSLYYVGVNDDQEQQLLANLHDTCAWSLPAGVAAGDAQTWSPNGEVHRD